MRYKVVKFDDFSDGERCDILDPTEKSFEMSENLIIEKNKIKLGKDIQTGALYNLAIEVTEYAKMSVIKNNYLYTLGYDTVSSENRIVGINIQTGNIWTVHTFSGGGDETHIFIKFKDKYIVSMLDGTYKIQYSTNLTAWTNCGTIGTGKIISDYKIVGDRLYVLCDDDIIYYSDDGIAFTLLVTLNSSYMYSDLNYLDGYFYLQIRTSSSGSLSSGIIRISLSGEIQDNIISLSGIYKFNSFVFNENMYVLVNERYLYRVVGSVLKPIFVFENNCIVVYSFGIIEKRFFWDSTDDKIITMNIFEKFSRPYKVPSALDRVWMIHQYDNCDTIAIGALSSVYKAIIYEDKYYSPGFIETKIYKFPKGLAVPKQVILNHKPLTANAWVKIYVKYDQASAWGSAVIDSNTLNAVRKVYDVPAGTKCNFIQFKIEYGTTDDSETPEDATVDLIYLPVGLSNSQ